MNIKIIFFILAASILSACTSLIPSRSSQKYAVIGEDPLLPSSMAYIDALANSHCNKYDSNAVFYTKEWNLPGSTIYYYACNKKMMSTQDDAALPILAPTGSTKINDIETAKQNCSQLGFKTGTEGFGKCVLQLSK